MKQCTRLHQQNDQKKLYGTRSQNQAAFASERGKGRRVALDPGLFAFLLVGAGVRAPSVLADHLQTLPPLLLFRLHLDKLGFYLGRVDVGVEIGHYGKDDAHEHQQRGKEDVLCPLVNTNTQFKYLS